MKPKDTEYKAPRSVSTPTGGLLMEMFERLQLYFGSLNWWPADTELEVMVGAVLTQNTNWNNVKKAIDNLKKRKILSLDGLLSVSMEDLAREIRPAGYYNIKSARLKNLVNYLGENFQGDLSLVSNKGTETLREELLSVKGIGPETADSILLYAFGRPVFVVDAYTHRILNRHCIFEEETSYHELQDFFQSHLPEEVPLYNEFHALIVMAGKNFCRKTPICDKCPLENWGPASPSR
ncbi:endonuclease III domain-containing protein [Thermodesulfobacteriota bacterium]